MKVNSGKVSSLKYCPGLHPECQRWLLGSIAAGDSAPEHLGSGLELWC